MMNPKQELYQILATATNVMNAEIKKQIVESGAVDTGRMKNVTVVKIDWRDGADDITLDIDTTEYYKYVSEGTKHIKARDITDKFMARKAVLNQLEKVYGALVKVKLFESLGQ